MENESVTSSAASEGINPSIREEKRNFHFTVDLSTELLMRCRLEPVLCRREC